MNIFVGKIGKSILFNPKSWGSIGGDNEAPKYYENLFVRNPEHTFYILGANDFSRLPQHDQDRINQHKNVIDIWDNFRFWKKANPTVSVNEQNIKYLHEWIENKGVTFNVGVIFAGPQATTNVAGKTTKMKNPHLLSKPIQMISKYAGPMISFLNDYKVPYAMIVNDPRYFPWQARDLFHLPTVVLSQYNETITAKHKKTYSSGEVVAHKVKAEYSGVETIFLTSLKRGGSAAAPKAANALSAFFADEPSASKEKDVQFMLVLNEGRPSRYKLLKESILNDVHDVSIYGKWDPEVIGDDDRFKGSVGFHELQEMLPRVKYTFCIPIKKGWVTSKFWEMAHYGIIPFLHSTYDDQNNLHCPEFLRIVDSKDLFKKIKFLEENPEAYKTLRENLDKLIKDEYYSGEFLNKLTVKVINDIAK